MLLATSVAQLTTAASVDVLGKQRRSHDLAHRLGVDSGIRMIAALTDEAWFQEALDREGEYNTEFKLGRCLIQVRVVDEGAKFDADAFGRPEDDDLLRSKLRDLAASYGLPQDGISLQPVVFEATGQQNRYISLDQLFHRLSPEDLWRWDDGTSEVRKPTEIDPLSPAWSDLVTCTGEGRVDLRRASEPVLRALLRDIDPAAAGKLIRAQKRMWHKELKSVGDPLSSVDADVREAVAGRIGWNLNRYGLDMYTTCGSDQRRWFVVTTISDGHVDIHQRSCVQW
jgi:hypothetical protein